MTVGADLRALADRLARAASPPVSPIGLVGVAGEAVAVLRFLADWFDAQDRAGS